MKGPRPSCTARLVVNIPEQNDFMYGMANDLEDATTSLSPYTRTNLACSKTELELLELQIYYHKVANEIGRCWTEEG